MFTTPTHHPRGNGPGLKAFGTEEWYGPGYCGICGADPVPQAVRWWDCDDGWRMGVLCVSCADEARERGPQPDDYAVVTRDTEELDSADRIDILHSMGDDDAAYSDSQDRYNH